MAEQGQNYRKKQAVLVILVFICIGVAFVSHSAAVAVGAILVSCAICFLAAKMQPEKAPDEHHHH
ncbi:MAG: hypothetical protein AB1491_13570 [Thermodesulfobacteriota bacterium]